ncbi:glycosyltransferase family 4 protein [uncultured Alistipes sp.]|uniref:glycosyltransferase family 4 protein n=1 Tax=uncultured Alistipes sp. TaxID=538949 RepID=UPI0028057CE6|nr:glycosyltransferase family 4 protein [uncultured Alistipes sp.]
MKLVYCIHSIYNPGGMERVLWNKVVYWTRHTDWEVVIVTTDQHDRPPFYPFPEQVRRIDLGINYSEDNTKSPLGKIAGYLRRRRLHKRRLTKLLMRERADVVVSLYPSESSFIPDIRDGSRKVLELHYCKFFRLQYGRKGLLGAIDRWRTRQDERIVRRFDKFVVLTHEDQGYWGALPNLEVIPNAAMHLTDRFADGSARRVIAVGRLDYQKGFDRLIRGWDLVQRSGRFADWRLDIFGQGEWHDMLQGMIDERGLAATTHLCRPTTQIGDEYARSSLHVMTSHYEGFGMVIVEAMACGLPSVAFDCKCGPKDIIRPGENGLLVRDGDEEGLAQALMTLMEDDALRKRMSQRAREVVKEYSEEAVMARWMRLFTSIVRS